MIISLQCKSEASKVTKEHVAASSSVFRIKCRIEVIRTKVLGRLASGNVVSLWVRTASTQSFYLLVDHFILLTDVQVGEIYMAIFFLNLFFLTLCSTSTIPAKVIHKYCGQDWKASLSLFTMARRWEMAEKAFSPPQASPHIAYIPYLRVCNK